MKKIINFKKRVDLDFIFDDVFEFSSNEGILVNIFLFWLLGVLMHSLGWYHIY